MPDLFDEPYILIEDAKKKFEETLEDKELRDTISLKRDDNNQYKYSYTQFLYELFMKGVGYGFNELFRQESKPVESVNDTEAEPGPAHG